MLNTAIITTTLSPHLAVWLKKESKKKGTTKREIIEEALRQYQAGQRRAELAESFERARQDPEIREFSEMGLGDYLHQLDKLDL